jgi:hypothetical protein
MTHALAVEKKLAERYLLSQLEDAEKEDFELHFFSCPACVRDLKDCVGFIDAAKPSLGPFRAPDPARSRGEYWWSWLLPRHLPALGLAGAVLTAFCIVAVYQGQQIASMRRDIAAYRQPRQPTDVPITPDVRGPAQSVVIPSDARDIELAIDLDSDQSFSAFRCEILAFGGSNPVSVTLAPPPAGQPLRLLIPAPHKPGPMRVRLFGASPGNPETEVVSRTIQFQSRNASE